MSGTTRTAGPLALLERWLARRLASEHRDWLEERLEKVLRSNADRELHIALGLVPRVLGRGELALDEAELAEAARLREGWDPSDWTVETAARALVLGRVGAARGAEAFAPLYVDLCRGADLGESLTLYRFLPLCPFDPAIDAQVGEGLRSNVRAVFEAIAHRNPWPHERFDENRWNHMVLKALFVGSALAPIQGLDERANAELARILGDYAHERWAAGRPVTPELWRCVGPFARGPLLDDLMRVLEGGGEREREAALLALAASPEPAAAALLARHPETHARIEDGSLDWNVVARAAAGDAA